MNNLVNCDGKRIYSFSNNSSLSSFAKPPKSIIRSQYVVIVEKLL